MAFIGFRMLFPAKAHDSMEAKIKSEELQDEPTANIAFVPLAMPSTAGPGTIAMIISSASTVKHGVDFRSGWCWRRRRSSFAVRGDSVGLSAQFRRDYASGWQRRHRGHLATDGLSAGLHGRAVY